MQREQRREAIGIAVGAAAQQRNAQGPVTIAGLELLVIVTQGTAGDAEEEEGVGRLTATAGFVLR